ncbi:hypothetical protein BDV98DRAFT_572163 [Pterulicium gracile]|uniref:Uncharacterized protein n=1 Tax=Pterulicium gracile TaxID=1884261 RepID=A0A5C3QB15_9AGAR|nr:hypothetical protein BDV98DRAFT_572163 [Pterula gracilis]
MDFPTDDPTLLTPENIMVISRLGMIIRYMLCHLLPGLILYGVYCTLTGVAMYTVATRPDKVTGRTIWLTLALIATMCLVTFDWCLAALIPLKTIIENGLLDVDTSSMTDRRLNYAEAIHASKIYVLAQWLSANTSDTGLLFIISDILACWRAIAIWGPTRRFRKTLRLALSFLVFVSFTFWAAYAGTRTQSYIATSGIPNGQSNEDLQAVLGMTASVASLASNLLATGIIGYVSWAFIHSGSVTAPNRSFRGSKVLVYLTESGAFYAVIQIIRLALTLSISPSTPTYGSLDTACAVFAGTSAIVTAMHTPAVILIVKYGLSIADTVQFSSAEGSANNGQQTISAIRFEKSLNGTNAESSTQNLSLGDETGSSRTGV